jgi:hypothetical protein
VQNSKIHDPKSHGQIVPEWAGAVIDYIADYVAKCVVCDNGVLFSIEL